MNDAISSAVAEAGILPEHREAAAAYLESVRAEATQVAVQTYIDRTVARDAGTQAAVILSAAFGRTYAVRGQDYYGPERWMYQSSADAGTVTSYARNDLVNHELGHTPKVTDDSNLAWTGDPFPAMFTFIEVTGDVDVDDVYEASMTDTDDDDTDDDDTDDDDTDD